MDPIFEALAALPTPAPQFHVVVDSVTASVESSTTKDALVAISSVAAVLWTGGLIVRQLFPSYLTMIVQNGMFFTMFAAFASIGALVTHGDVLRIMVACFLAVYVRVAILAFWHYYRQKNTKEPLPIGLTNVPLYFKSYRLGNWIQILMLAFYIPIIILPTTECVAWTTFFALFLGYQMILGHLSQARRQDDGMITIAGGLLRVLQYLDRWNGLIPAPAAPDQPKHADPEPQP